MTTESPKRIGDWMQTHSGKMFYPTDPREEDIDIEDIAHALSHICRFAGHCNTFYSVAEHSVRVADEVHRQSRGVPARDVCALVLHGLLHDAAEAYLVDIPRPLKMAPGLEYYRAYERTLERVIFRRFGLPDEIPAVVKQADQRLLVTEGRDLLGPHPAPWGYAQGTKAEPLEERIEPMPSDIAKTVFLRHFRRYAEAGGTT